MRHNDSGIWALILRMKRLSFTGQKIETILVATFDTVTHGKMKFTQSLLCNKKCQTGLQLDEATQANFKMDLSIQ